VRSLFLGPPRQHNITNRKRIKTEKLKPSSLREVIIA
jgi:hypothetical protein